MPDQLQTTDRLYMTQLWLEMRRLVELARALHLPLQQVDHNYIAHCAMGELFGEEAPRPFCVEENNGKYLRVLGYGSLDSDGLRSVAELDAGPMVYEACDWPRMASKPMPTDFTAGTRLGFELRACPVVRKSSAGKHHGAGVEVDAFLSRVWEVDDPQVPIEREEVYRDWLTGHLERRGGCRPVSIGLERFSIERMLRRTQGNDRTSKTIKRPDVTLTGEVEVTDAEAFADLLWEGIGRHKSFGFGMLKIRRPSSQP
jgi:CRISPR system Cascade subunit CasE